MDILAGVLSPSARRLFASQEPFSNIDTVLLNDDYKFGTPRWSHMYDIAILSAAVILVLLPIALLYDFVVESYLLGKSGARARLWVQTNVVQTKYFYIVVEGTNVLLSLSILIIYVEETYEKDMHPATYAYTVICDIFFIFYYAFFFIIADVKWAYVLRPARLGDILVMVSIVVAPLLGTYLQFSYIRVATIVTGLKHMRIGEWKFMSKHAQMLVLLVTQTLVIVVILASTVHLLEALGNPEWMWDSDENEMTWVESIYFMFVTITTVGYGDFSPSTTIGRFFCVLAIISGIGFFTWALNEMLTIYQENKYGKGSLYLPRGWSHIIVGGELSKEIIADFLEGFISQAPKHVTETRNLVCVMNPNLSIGEGVKDLVKTKYPRNLKYFHGSLMNVDDVERVDGSKALAFFILGDRLARDLRRQDSVNILRVMAIRRFYPNANIFAMCGEVENKHNFMLAGVEKRKCLCANELRLGLAALNCMTPGASTFLSNLIVNEDIGSRNHKSLMAWEKEYFSGVDSELLFRTFSPQLVDKPFKTASEVLFNSCGASLIGVVGTTNTGTRQVILAPDQENFIIKPGYTAVILGFEAKVSSADFPPPQAQAQAQKKSNVVAPADSGEAEAFSYERMNLGVTDLIIRAMQTSNPNPEYEELLEKQAMYEKRQNSLRRGLRPHNYCGLNDIRLGDAQKHKERREAGDASGIPVIHKNRRLPFSQHTVVIGNTSDIYHFVHVLRNEDMRPFAPIVILDTNLSPEVSKSLSLFDDVYHYDGSAKSKDDMYMVCADAANVVILGSGGKEAESEPQMLDGETILSLINVEALAPHANKVTEMMRSENVTFLKVRQGAAVTSFRTVGEVYSLLKTHPRLGNKLLFNKPIREPAAGPKPRRVEAGVAEVKQDHFFKRPRYAAGNLFISSFLQSLLAQAYYYNDTLTVIEALVTGTFPLHLSDYTNGVTRLYQTAVRKEWVDGKYSYGRVVSTLRKESMVAVGLYRSPEGTDATLPYVLSSPDRDIAVRKHDKIYVVGCLDNCRYDIAEPTVKYFDSTRVKKIQSMYRARFFNKMIDRVAPLMADLKKSIKKGQPAAAPTSPEKPRMPGVEAGNDGLRPLDSYTDDEIAKVAKMQKRRKAPRGQAAAEEAAPSAPADDLPPLDSYTSEDVEKLSKMQRKFKKTDGGGGEATAEKYEVKDDSDDDFPGGALVAGPPPIAKTGSDDD